LVKEYFWQPLKASDTKTIQHQQPQTAVQKWKKKEFSPVLFIPFCGRWVHGSVNKVSLW
jgi:hypothetical protein